MGNIGTHTPPPPPTLGQTQRIKTMKTQETINAIKRQATQWKKK